MTLLDEHGNTKPNGDARIETRESWQEMKRKRRRATVGEIEAAFNQLAQDMERYGNALIGRIERLEKLAGYIQKEPDALLAAQREGGDVE